MHRYIARAALAASIPAPLLAAALQHPTMEARMTAQVETIAEDLDGGTGGVSIDREGRVYVADFGKVLGDRKTMGRRIFRLKPGGAAEVFATGFEGASGNTFNSSGILFQSNIRGNSISRIEPDGTHTMFVREGIANPVGIAIDDQDVLFVANCGNGTIRRVMPDGSSHPFVEHDLLKCPNGITLDERHTLYVANFDNGDVTRITREGEVSRLATLPGNNNGHLTYHAGILYVVARSDHRIYRVSLEGEVAVFAGTGIRGHRDGPAADAEFSYPNDIAFDPRSGAFYVNEIASTSADATLLSPMIVRRIRLEPEPARGKEKAEPDSLPGSATTARQRCCPAGDAPA